LEARDFSRVSVHVKLIVKGGGSLPQKKRQKPPVGEKECTNCRKIKKLSNFYLASNPATSSDGRTVNVCKACVKRESLNSDGSLNIENFKNMLMLMDKPYVPSSIDSAINETQIAISTGKGRKDLIGNYMKNIASLPQYSKLSFLESIKLVESGNTYLSSTSVTSTEKKQRDNEEIYVKQVDDFVVTDDLLDLFGEGYTKNEYRLMKKKYDDLKQNYTLQTNLHQEALATYVRFKVKEEQATASGNVGEADKWNTAANKAAEAAKLTPKQLTQSDLQGGINSFSEIFRAVEQAVDIIPILPQFKTRPNDSLDFLMWCYINYVRDLQGLPHCSYEDVYKFYDKKKEEYIAQYGDTYGIFKDDISEDLRPNIQKFITLPKDYEDGDDE
jgi:hypothetical protein